MKVTTYRRFGIVGVAAMSFGVAGCSDGERASSEGEAEPASSEAAAENASSEGSGEHARSEGSGEHASSEGSGEHDEGGEEGEHGSGGAGEGEESGEYIGPADTWDKTRRGARLVLAFNAASNSFVGTVENTTGQTLCAIRVEVHLSTGTELGPTERTDLPSGEKTTVELPTAGEAFDTWTAHPELSSCGGG
jgi:hypothetical protein